MKKPFIFLALIGFLFSLVSCGGSSSSDKPDPHTHTYSEQWTSNETHHWHAATCEHTNEKSNYEVHIFGNWVTRTEPTETTDGLEFRTCTVCTYEQTQVIPALEHTHTYASTWSSNETQHWHAATCGHDVKADVADHSFGNWITRTEPTETTDGLEFRTCTVCAYEETQAILALEHTHTYASTWSSNETQHWHAATCGHDVKADVEDHSFGNWITRTEPTEESEGLEYRTCTVCAYEQTHVIPALEHTHTYASTWSSNETQHWHAATCGHDVKADVKDHSFGNWITRTEPTEESEGLEYRTCTVCSYEQTQAIPALEHTHTYASTWSFNTTQHWHGATCGHDVKDSVANHSFGNWITRTEPTEESEGLEYRTCTVCSYEETWVIPALEHTHTYSDTWSYDETQHWHAATCGHDVKADITDHNYVDSLVLPVGKELGYTEHACTECDYVYRDNYTAIIDFYAINDLHGIVTESDDSAGISKTATYFKILQESQNVVIVSQGDMFQGTVESNSNRGNLISEWMREIGCVSMTYGNHEFDWGTNGMFENIELAEFPFLGINIIYNESGAHPGQRVDYASPSVVVEVAGVRIGVIGAIGNCLSSISGEMSRDIYFVTGSELSNLVKAESIRLRQEENCDFIIYSIHGSGRDDEEDTYDEELSTLGYVDVVFEGHTHTLYKYKDTGDVYHVQGSAYGRGIYHYQIIINTDTDDYEVRRVEYISTKEAMSSLASDPDVDYLINVKYDVSSAYSVIGYNDEYKNADELRQIIADKFLELGQEKWTEYDIFLAGGYMSCRSPGYLPVGDVTYAQIYQLFPFENDIVLCSIDGEHLKRQFMYNTNRYYFISYQEGASVETVIDDNATYYIVTDTYSCYHAPNGCTEIARYSTNGYYQRDIISDAVKNNEFHHVHTYSDEWSYSPAEHWHAATCIHTYEKSDVGFHDFTNWTIRTEATNDTDGLELRVCRVCSYEETSIIPAYSHTHTYSDTWSYDETQHWHAATCGHDDMIDMANHDFGTPPSDGIYTCSVCGYVYFSEDLYQLTYSFDNVSKRYSTGNYGYFTVDGFTSEYYRAIKNDDNDTYVELLDVDYNYEDDELGGAIYNVSSIYGIKAIVLTYSSSESFNLIYGHEKLLVNYDYDDYHIVAYNKTIESSNAKKEAMIIIDEENINFFKIETNGSNVFIYSLKVYYDNEEMSYWETVPANLGYDHALPAPNQIYDLVDGFTTATMPDENGNNKTYTYYSTEYVVEHYTELNLADVCYVSPVDVSNYYMAFRDFPANYLFSYERNQMDLNNTITYETVFGSYARLVQEFSRTDGYVRNINTPFTYSTTGLPLYYELDINLTNDYSTQNRGVGRVVIFVAGVNRVNFGLGNVGEDPICYFTDDHYATFREYDNNGQFGVRIGVERTISAFSDYPMLQKNKPTETVTINLYSTSDLDELISFDCRQNSLLTAPELLVNYQQGNLFYLDRELTKPITNVWVQDGITLYVRFESPKTPAEILEIASTLAPGEETTTSFLVEGVIREITSGTYCNFYLVGGLYVYGLYDEQGNRYGSNSGFIPIPTGFATGKTVLLYGKIKNYNGTIELVNTILISIRD